MGFSYLKLLLKKKKKPMKFFNQNFFKFSLCFDLSRFGIFVEMDFKINFKCHRIFGLSLKKKKEKEKEKENIVLVLTFWSYSQFSPYILVAINLVNVIFNF